MTAMPPESSTWNCSGVSAGASKAAEPSGATGTVPRIRLMISLLTWLRIGLERVGWLMICETRSRLMLPRSIGCVLWYTSWTKK